MPSAMKMETLPIHHRSAIGNVSLGFHAKVSPIYYNQSSGFCLPGFQRLRFRMISYIKLIIVRLQLGQVLILL